jgi:hypothetical protein
MKKDYTTPSMVITSFSNEVVIMASGITKITESSQQASDFTALTLSSDGKWNK